MAGVGFGVPHLTPFPVLGSSLSHQDEVEISSLPPVDLRTRYSEANEDADILLVSSDDIDFHVNSVVLKLSSSVFRDMLSIPQPRETPADEPKLNGHSRKDAIPVSENADVLCLLLDIINPGRGLSADLAILADKQQALSVLKSAGLAAVKYDMVSASNAIRAFVVSPKAISRYNAVELYGVAFDLGFIEEAKQLSNKTLSCNLDTLDARKHLENMGLNAVLKLQHLHRSRKILLINTLNTWTGDDSYYADAVHRYGVGGGYFGSLSLPWQVMISHRAKPTAQAASFEWLQLKMEILRVMEESVDGAQFFREEHEFFYQKRFETLRGLLDFRLVAREFRRIFDHMPKEIDV